MTRRLLTLRATLAYAVISGALVGPIASQENPTERLQREQNEILRKAERLRELMTRLLTRYERDGRAEQVALLEGGLAHLEKSRLLAAAAEIPTNLDSGAYDNAVREQATVIAELESLLDILLERQSIENLDEEIEQTEQLIEQAGELIDRQRQLREQGQQVRDRAPQSETEQELVDMLARLADAQRAESVANQQRAGRQLPILEAALARVEDLLQQQQELEESAAQQLTGAKNPAREEGFELGSIEQTQRDLNAERARQRELERLAEDAAELSKAAAEGSDADRLREALNQVRARLDAATTSARKAADDATAEQLEQTREAMRGASADARDAESKEQLKSAASEVQRTSAAAAEARRQEIDTAQRALIERTREAATNAQESRDGQDSESTDTSKALDRAAKSMEQSTDREAMEDASAAASSALRQLAEARRSQRAANPDPVGRARQMANSAEDVARDLRAAPESGDPEVSAAEALDAAENALRDAESELDRASSGEGDADQAKVERQLNSSRAGLEQAMESLQGAMQSVNAESSQEQSSAAASRQRDLQQQAAQAKERLEAARSSGDLDQAQADSASAAIDRAQESMGEAASKLEAGQPSSASKSQATAAEQLDEAADAIEENRPIDEAERRDLEQLAKQQEQLEEDIIRLAELAKERENKKATDALNRAAEASNRAQRQLDEGDQPEAEREQQEVEQQLEQAQEALEEERDRYMDLRQEELLFRIREELTQFLEVQRPLTRQTAEAGAGIAERGRLSRPERRKLNQVAEREGELVARTEFILAALIEEGILVFAHALRANVQDLEDIRERLSGRRPDPGEFTVMLQRDVEERAQKLIQALLDEQERRRQEQQQQQQPQNQFGDQKKPLVPLIAELEMLRQMEEDMQLRTRNVQRLLAASGADGITEFDVALSDRLASQHSAISDIFKQIRSAIEQQMEQGEGGGADPFGPDEDGESKEQGTDKERRR